MEALTLKKMGRLIDHSLLKPQITQKDIEEGVEIARRYECYSVCVKPYDVAYCAKALEGTNTIVSAVVGFPHGNSTIPIKVAEAIDVIENGAKEIDVVMAIAKVKSGDFHYLEDELTQITRAAHERDCVVKVIFENYYLTKDEIAQCSRIADAVGVDCVKTSTGFAPGGATLEDVQIMRDNVSDRVFIKAAGGISDFAGFQAMYEAGCTRIGVSRTVAIMQDAEKQGIR